MPNERECINCGKTNDSETWEKGECCLFGTLYACSRACALAYVKKYPVENFDEATDLVEM